MKLTNLQNIILPDRKICHENDLYFRFGGDSLNAAHYDELEHKLIFQKYSQSTFDTYFNSFSLNKWIYYTKLNSLYLKLKIKGKFILWVLSSSPNDRDTISSIITMEKITEDNVSPIEIPISKIKDGSIYFKLQALEHNSEFYGGEWCTTIEEEELNPSPKIAIVICTYKREEYIRQNVELINERLFNDPDCSLKDKLYIYIVDNGRTLDTQKYSSLNIRVMPNINAGGSGGFARGMLAANADQDKYALTHILLMDDDVRIEPESITRTLNFLKFIKPEFANAFIGGSMMRMDKPGMIYESGAVFNTRGYRALKLNLDVTLWNNVLFNEVQENFNYFAWWYCVIPMSIANEENLPLPIFMRLDDVEYGLRNMKQGIALNGISVWHEPFERRHSSVLEYYYMRNFMIIGASRNIITNPYTVISVMLRKIVLGLLHYNYNECDQVFDAIEDYYKGLDWLINQDPEELHVRVSSKAAKFQDVRELNFDFNLGKYFDSLYTSDDGFKKLIRRITFNGYLLPTNSESIVTNDVTQGRKRIINMYRTKQVMQYDITSNRGAIFERSLSKSFFIIVRFVLISLKLLFTLHLKNIEYRKRSCLMYKPNAFGKVFLGFNN